MLQQIMVPRHNMSHHHIIPNHLTKNGSKFIMQGTDIFLYYARAVDGEMLTAPSAIASKQLDPINPIMNKYNQLLN